MAKKIQEITKALGLNPSLTGGSTLTATDSTDDADDAVLILLSLEVVL